MIGAMSAHKILKEIIEEKKRVNPRLSLRAIAAKMEISSGRLSEILSEKRPLTEHYLDKACLALKLSAEDTARLRRALLKGDGGDEDKKGYGHLLSEQEVALLADWKSYALMSFFQTVTYRALTAAEPMMDAQIAKISGRVGIAATEVKKLIEVMSAANLIKWERDHWTPEFQSATTGYDIPSQVIKAGLEKDLDLAREKLHALEVFERDFSSMTLVMDSKDMVKAKKMIRTFRRSFAKSLEQGEKKEVFQLSLQFFPITKSSD